MLATFVLSTRVRVQFILSLPCWKHTIAGAQAFIHSRQLSLLEPNGICISWNGARVVCLMRKSWPMRATLNIWCVCVCYEQRHNKLTDGIQLEFRIVMLVLSFSISTCWGHTWWLSTTQNINHKKKPVKCSARKWPRNWVSQSKTITYILIRKICAFVCIAFIYLVWVMSHS